MKIWKSIPDFPGYEVSDGGEVRSLDRIVPHPKGNLTLKGQPIKVWVNKGGYQMVTLRREGKAKHFSVHILVAKQFLGDRSDDGLVVCHGPNGQSDNSCGNLRWDTQSNNILDQVREGTHNESRKDSCPLGHDLRAPNLRAGQLKAGKRACLACSRGRNRFNRDQNPDATLKEHADKAYREIIGV